MRDCFRWPAVCSPALHQTQRTGCQLQYTIEARELTNEYTHRPSYDVESRRVTVEANDSDEAITQYVQSFSGELVSFSTPARGRESIATVKREDIVFLVRVYAG